MLLNPFLLAAESEASHARVPGVGQVAEVYKTMLPLPWVTCALNEYVSVVGGVNDQTVSGPGAAFNGVA